MKKNPDIKKFNQLLHKYQFADPLSSDIQGMLRYSKSKQFKKTFKRTTGYSVIFAILAGLYFRIKRMGIPVTIMKSAILAGLASIIIIAAVTTGIYWLFIKDQAGTMIKQEMLREHPSASGSNIYIRKGDVRDVIETTAVIDDRIGVQTFSAINLPAEQAEQVSDRMASILSELRGSDRVINLRLGRGGKKSGMMLFGSLELVEGSYTFTARLVSIKDSKIIFYDTEIIKSVNDIDEACDRLARKIYSRVK
jgi:hypothetical protein